MKSRSLVFFVKETNINFYAWSLIADGFESPLAKRYLGASWNGSIMKIENDNGAWGTDIDEWSDLGRRTVERLQNNNLDLDKILAEHKRAGEALFKLCGKIEQSDSKRAGTAQFMRWFRDIWQHYVNLNIVGLIPVASDFEHFRLTKFLSKILKRRGITQDKIQEQLSILISSTIPTLYWQEQLDLLNLCRRSKNAKQAAVSRQLDKHANEYVWLNYGYQGPAWKRQDFIDRIQRIFKHKATVGQQYQEHKNRLSKLKSQQQSLFKKFKLNQDEKRLFTAAQLFMRLKAYRIEVRHRVNYISDLLFAELCRQRQMSLNLFHYATREEILKIIAGKKVNQSDILKRRQGMLQIRERGHNRFISHQKQAQYLRKYLKPEKKVSGSTARGHVAFRGNARGQVKIVYSINDLFKVNHGDILVAIATNPDFLPAMNKAIAFVTDSGGITSHAAIVAREMKKPCIIGTKVATKIFQDGDVVEVDAEKGEVRKVNQK